MLRILEAKTDTQNANEHLITVNPRSSEAAGGKLLASKKDDGSNPKDVGTWKSEEGENGTGTATTSRGVYLFATQGDAISPAYPLPAVVPK